jgi:hypothetical protein
MCKFKIIIKKSFDIYYNRDLHHMTFKLKKVLSSVIPVTTAAEGAAGGQQCQEVSNVPLLVVREPAGVAADGAFTPEANKH